MDFECDAAINCLSCAKLFDQYVNDQRNGMMQPQLFDSYFDRFTIFPVVATEQIWKFNLVNEANAWQSYTRSEADR
jgi:hypothetical protein